MEKEGFAEEEKVREEQEIGVGFPAGQVTYKEALPTNKWNPGQGTWPGVAFASSVTTCKPAALVTGTFS